MAQVKLALLASCLLLAALVFWQGSFFSIPTPSAPVQLKVAPAPAPAVSNDVAAAPSKDEAAPAPGKDTTNAATKPASTRVTRRNPPAAATVERRANAVPPAAAPDVNVAPVRLMTYERRVADAAALAGQDSDRALLDLQRLAADEPSRPEAYEAMAGISLRKRDYGQAREALESAIGHGGKATFRLIHDHNRGNFESSDPKATCVGELTILADEVRFDAAEEGGRFSANWASIRDAGSNRFFGSGIGGFHVSIAGNKYQKNFNLAPESKDKAEGKLILELLSAYSRRSDRTK
jgi:hypothetical protein